jgi:hypothetical protein
MRAVEDWRMRLLQRLELHRHVVEPVEFAGERSASTLNAQNDVEPLAIDLSRRSAS